VIFPGPAGRAAAWPADGRPPGLPTGGRPAPVQPAPQPLFALTPALPQRAL